MSIDWFSKAAFSMLDPTTQALLVQFGIDPAQIETLISGTLWLTAVAVLAAIPTAMLAKRKARSVFWWVVLALSVPVLPLLIVWLLPVKTAQPGDDPTPPR
jgi:hypothetical protein